MKSHKSKIVITGTGRCGTTFLIRLLTEIGLNTGYTKDEADWTVEVGKCNGGIEHPFGSDILKRSEIIKNPDFAVDFDRVLREINVRHIIVPIRDREKVVESREFQTKNKENPDSYGGLTQESKQEEMIFNSHLIYDLIVKASRHDIPLTFINYPKMIFDKEYLEKKLSKAFKSNLFKNNFDESFDKIANKDLIHF